METCPKELLPNSMTISTAAQLKPIANTTNVKSFFHSKRSARSLSLSFHSFSHGRGHFVNVHSVNKWQRRNQINGDICAVSGGWVCVRVRWGRGFWGMVGVSSRYILVPSCKWSQKYLHPCPNNFTCILHQPRRTNWASKYGFYVTSALHNNGTVAKKNGLLCSQKSVLVSYH